MHWVSLQILHSPPGKDLVIVSPYDDRTLVPPFKNTAENFVRVVVIERGNFAVLQDPSVLRAFAERINKANAPKTADKQAAEDPKANADDPKANLDAVAKRYGLSSENLDRAIRAWGSENYRSVRGWTGRFVRPELRQGNDRSENLSRPTREKISFGSENFGWGPGTSG